MKRQRGNIEEMYSLHYIKKKNALAQFHKWALFINNRINRGNYFNVPNQIARLSEKKKK